MKKFYKVLILTGIFTFGLVMAAGFFAPLPSPDYVPPAFVLPEEGGVISPFPTLFPTAFQYFSLKRFMGYPLGWLYPIAMARFALTSVWFVLAVYFLLQYLRGFYGPRKIPLSWLLIVAGLLITNIAEIGENFSGHEWPYHGFIELNFLLILPHFWGGLLLFLGARQLLKEIKGQES